MYFFNIYFSVSSLAFVASREDMHILLPSHKGAYTDVGGRAVQRYLLGHYRRLWRPGSVTERNLVIPTTFMNPATFISLIIVILSLSLITLSCGTIISLLAKVPSLKLAMQMLLCMYYRDRKWTYLPTAYNCPTRPEDEVSLKKVLFL